MKIIFPTTKCYSIHKNQRYSTVLCQLPSEIMRRKIPEEEAPLITNIETELDTALIKMISNEDNMKVVETKGISITWRNLKVSTKVEKNGLFQSTYTLQEIIHNAKGYVESSSLVAILGASGSGKSTLMSALSSRQTGDLKVEGDVLVNGSRVQQKTMKKISGFVYQDDMFTNALTVSEHLHLAAKLKLTKYLTSNQRENLVNELMMDVGLTDCANRLISSSDHESEKKTLSGGELKRLSVATELITDPPLLFCDEPTTGLDSFTAFKLMKLMSNMTREKARTIVCSIHQPSVKIFDLFDQIILLQNGKVAFLGTTTDAMVFFQSIGYTYNENQNPAEYLIKSLTVIPGQEFQTDDVCSKFQRSRYAELVNRRIERESRELNFILPENVGERISWSYALYLLTYRNLLNIVRNPKVQLMQFTDSAIVASLMGVLMMGNITLTQEGIFAFKGVIFSLVTHNSLVASDRILNHFPSRMPGFLREYSNDMNTPLIFYFSNIIAMIPEALFDATFQLTVLYSLSGLKRTWSAFLMTLGITIVIRFTGTAFGILISLAIKKVAVAHSIVTSVNLVFKPISGVWFNVSSLPWAISWLRYVSWMTYGMETFFIIQMDGVDHIRCRESPDLPCLKNGQEVLESLGFDAGNFRRNVIAMCCICLILQILGFVVSRMRLS